MRYSACAWVILLAAVVSLLWSGAFLLVGIIDGRWGEFLGRARPPTQSVVIAVVLLAGSFVLLALAKSIHRSQPEAIRAAVVVTWVIFVGIAAVALIDGVYCSELVLWGIPLASLHLAAYAERNTPRRPLTPHHR